MRRPRRKIYSQNTAEDGGLSLCSLNSMYGSEIRIAIDEDTRFIVHSKNGKITCPLVGPALGHIFIYCVLVFNLAPAIYKLDGRA